MFNIKSRKGEDKAVRGVGIMLSTCTVFGAMKEEHQVNNMVGPKLAK